MFFRMFLSMFFYSLMMILHIRVFLVTAVTAVVFLACASKGDVLLGNVSNPTLQKMSHDFRYVGRYDGFCYGVYNAGYCSTEEHPKHLDIDLRIVKWLPEDAGVKYSFQVAKAGDGRTDFYRPPYDPTGFIECEKLYCMYCPSVDSTATYVCRVFNMKSETFEGEESVMTLDGQPMTVWNVLNIYNEKSPVKCSWILDGSPEKAFGLGLNVKIVKYGDAYYSCLSEVGGTFCGMIIRSYNLTDWETVAIPNLTSLPRGQSFWEGSVFPLKNGLFAYTARLQNEDGVVFGLWNPATGQFSHLQLVPDAIVSRPELFEFRGEVYLACNIHGPSDVEGYGSVYRATCAFFRINPDEGSLERVRTKTVAEGIHYFTFYSWRGNLYMVYSTDSRRLNAREARSNIALERIVLR